MNKTKKSTKQSDISQSFSAAIAVLLFLGIVAFGFVFSQDSNQPAPVFAQTGGDTPTVSSECEGVEDEAAGVCEQNSQTTFNVTLNQQPTAGDYAAVVAPGESVTIDLLNPSRPNGDGSPLVRDDTVGSVENSLTGGVNIIISPQFRGDATIAGSNNFQITYTAPNTTDSANFIETFEYTVSDGESTSDPATIQIGVDGPPQANISDVRSENTITSSGIPTSFDGTGSRDAGYGVNAGATSITTNDDVAIENYDWVIENVANSDTTSGSGEIFDTTLAPGEYDATLTASNGNGQDTDQENGICIGYDPANGCQPDGTVEGGGLGSLGELSVEPATLYTVADADIDPDETAILDIERSSGNFASEATVRAFVVGQQDVSVQVRQAGYGNPFEDSVRFEVSSSSAASVEGQIDIPAGGIPAGTYNVRFEVDAYGTTSAATTDLQAQTVSEQ